MVSKHMRHQTAGGQSTGVECVTDRPSRVQERAATAKKPRERQTTRRRSVQDSDSKAADVGSSAGEGVGGLNDVGLDCRLLLQGGNQLGELADSERVFPPPTSHVATLNRELKALEVRYFRTRLHLEKATDKNDQLRREMKKVLATSTKQEREISKLRHLIDRIQSERKQMELQAISNRDYAQKIEHRFFLGTKGKTLAQCNLELSARVRTLEETLKDKQATLEQVRSEAAEARDKLTIVQRALETRLEAHELNGSLHTGLLFEISRLQDHSEALALQLSQERKQSTTQSAELQDALSRKQQLEDAGVTREAWVATLEKERATLDDKLAQAAEDAQTAACEKAALLRFIHEQAEAKFQLEARFKDEQAGRHREREAAQHALQLWGQEKQRLELAVHSAQQDVEGQRQESERVGEALRGEREASAALRERERELELELERLGESWKKMEEELSAAKDVCRELQTTITQHEESEQALRTEVKELVEARDELQTQLESKRMEERALREAMESALQDLAALSRQRNDAAKAMSEAVTISASSLEEQQALERQVDKQRSQLEQLKSSKALLQNAMLEQLAALRKQLHVERRQRIEAEARLKHLRAPAETAGRASPPRIAPVAHTGAAATLPAEGTEGRNEEDEALQPLSPPCSPSPSPSPLSLPSYLSTSAQLPQQKSCLSSGLASPSPSSSSSSEEETWEVVGDDAACIKPLRHLEAVAPLPISTGREVESPETTPLDEHLSLLELAGEPTS